jgi:hypothetical protein
MSVFGPKHIKRRVAMEESTDKCDFKEFLEHATSYRYAPSSGV